MQPDFSTAVASLFGSATIVLVVPGGLSGLASLLSSAHAAVTAGASTQSGAGRAGSNSMPVQASSAPEGAARSDTPVATPEVKPSQPSRPASTPGERAQEYFAKNGDKKLDRRAWAKLTKTSRRRIDRIFALDEVPTTQEGGGKSNRLEFAPASAMAFVLTTVEAVQAGKIDAPEWYERVIRPHPRKSSETGDATIE